MSRAISHVPKSSIAPLTGRGWQAALVGSQLVVGLSGDWIARVSPVERTAVPRLMSAGASGLAFDASRLGRWDSALIVFLVDLRTATRGGRVTFDETGLPAPARKLLAMACGTALPGVTHPQGPWLDQVGLWALSLGAEAIAISTLLGKICLRSAALPGRSSAMRGSDLFDSMGRAGLASLPIVTAVNFLIGAILGFVGAIQLRRFGADIYVAGLVGIAAVREMAALMTAIVMAGRTGGAYAATVATMQANEELDALQVVGIGVVDYVILPRVLALTAMLPVLYLYGCAVAICGGWVVATLTLHIAPIAFLTELRASLALDQFGFGLVKSVAFGALVGVVGCQVGLRAGRSAADVGQATTTAVVSGVVGVILLDAIFALCAHAVGV
jgi:phospholipid/cholesterol/gamma-HCH transport system permease protein